MENKELEQEYIKIAEAYMLEIGAPNGADAAFIEGVKYGLKLREQELG